MDVRSFFQYIFVLFRSSGRVCWLLQLRQREDLSYRRQWARVLAASAGAIVPGRWVRMHRAWTAMTAESATSALTEAAADVPHCAAYRRKTLFNTRCANCGRQAADCKRVRKAAAAAQVYVCFIIVCLLCQRIACERGLR